MEDQGAKIAGERKKKKAIFACTNDVTVQAFSSSINWKCDGLFLCFFVCFFCFVFFDERVISLLVVLLMNSIANSCH